MKTYPNDFCMGCMSPLNINEQCTNCNFSLDTYKTTPRCLPPGTLLSERYLIGRVLGEGSFGITYIGRDLLLGIVVAIKEYFPLSYGSRDVRKGTDHTVYVYHGNADAMYQKGLEQFYNEAKILSRFHMLDGIVSVRDFFHANKTAYIVMDYIDGITLKEYVKKSGTVSGAETLQWMKPVIQSLQEIHQAGIIHRDISPDNLLLTQQRNLVLVDFGSARVENRAMTQSMTVMFKRGYTPEEQYLRHGKQGAWSDVYSLCATMYYMLTGVVPNEAIERMLRDDMVPLSKIPEIQLTPNQKEAIMQGISVKPEERLQNMQELSNALYRKENKLLIYGKRFYYWERKHFRAELLCISIFFLCSIIGTKLFYSDKQKSYPTIPTTVPFETITSVPTQTPVPERIQMQAFTGLTKEQAKQRFIALGDKNLTIDWKTDYSNTIPKGTVITQNIPENTSYYSGSFQKLVLTVSKGRKKVTIPLVTGLSYETAVSKLKKKKLSYRLSWQNSEENINTVLSQNKKAGKKVSVGTTIHLIVSNGPAQPPSPNAPATTPVPTHPPASAKKSDDSFVGTIP